MNRKFAGLILLFFALSCTKSSQQVIIGSGVFEGTEILVSSEANGQLLKMYVDEGYEIQQQDTVARVDDEKLVLQKEQLIASLGEIDFLAQNALETINQAEENFNNIEKRYNRISALFKNSTATQQQMDDTETQYKNSKTQLLSARTNLKAVGMKKKQIKARLKLIDSQIDDCTIFCPASGVVIEKHMEQGELVAAGTPLITIADLQNLWIKLYVPEPDLGYVKLGSNADIRIDSYKDKVINGKIVWISPKAEFTPHNVQTQDARADLVYAVKVSVPNPDGILKIGMPADIEVQK